MSEDHQPDRPTERRRFEIARTTLTAINVVLTALRLVNDWIVHPWWHF